MVRINITNYIQYFLWFHYVHFFNRICIESIRKVLQPATSAQVFLGFPVSISEC